MKTNKNQISFKNEKFGSEYYKEENIYLQEILTAIRSICSNENPKTVLDLGCGSGMYSKLFKNSEYCGIDMCDEIINFSKKNGLNIIKHDLEEPIPLENKSFDCIISVDTIEHIYDTVAHLKNINNILKDDGFFIMITPNISSLASRINILRGKRPSEVDAYRSDGEGQDHISAFGIDDIKKIMELSGFEIEVLSGINSGRFTKKYLQWFVDRGVFVSMSSSFLVKVRKIK